MSDEPIVIDELGAAETRRVGTVAARHIKSASQSEPYLPDAEAPIEIRAGDPDEDTPPDVGAMLIAILVGTGLWSGIIWAVFHWLVR